MESDRRGGLGFFRLLLPLYHFPLFRVFFSQLGSLGIAEPGWEKNTSNNQTEHDNVGEESRFGFSVVCAPFMGQDIPHYEWENTHFPSPLAWLDLRSVAANTINAFKCGISFLSSRTCFTRYPEWALKWVDIYLKLSKGRAKDQ